MATDTHAYWRAGMAGAPMQAHPDDPQPGFYRRFRREGPDDAVAYVISQAGEIAAVLNGKYVDNGEALWTYVCDKYVSYEAYTFRIDNGRWPNENEVVLGHNRPPLDNSLESVSSVFDALKAEAARLIKAGVAMNQAQADQASDIANELADVAKKAVAFHKTEKAPIAEQAKAIDRKWFPLRDAATELKERVRAIVLTPFLSEQRRIAESMGVEAKIGAGSLKRTTALRKVISANIDNYQQTMLYFANTPEMRELVQRLADRAVRAGTEVPGCTRIEQEKAV